ncbi:nucleotidyltransferase domain-containing protein [Hydrogenimonas sp.]
MMTLETIKKEITPLLLPLAPEKVLLFGSYAYGQPHEESDIDLFVVKQLPDNKIRDYKIALKQRLLPFIRKHHIGIDIIVSDAKTLENRPDYFFRKELKEKAVVLYE